MVEGGYSTGGLLADGASGRSEGGASVPSQSSEPHIAEELIHICNDDPGPAPFYVVCFNGRPLQVIPPDGSGAHIVLFSNLKLAQSFATERGLIYPDETVGLSPVAGIGDVLRLARAESRDPNYITPPCGLVLDFSYSDQARVFSVAPMEINRMNSAYLARIVSERMAK